MKTKINNGIHNFKSGTVVGWCGGCQTLSDTVEMTNLDGMNLPLCLACRRKNGVILKDLQR
jgi:hypothetical protein